MLRKVSLRKRPDRVEEFRREDLSMDCGFIYSCVLGRPVEDMSLTMPRDR